MADLPEVTEHTTLGEFVQDKGENPVFVAESEAEAQELIDRRIRGYENRVPPVIIRRAVLEVGADLYNRRQARNGIVGFETVDLQPLRIARDPLKAAYDLVDPYLGPVIGG